MCRHHIFSIITIIIFCCFEIFLRLDLRPNIWSVLVNVLYTLEKKVCYIIFCVKYFRYTNWINFVNDVAQIFYTFTEVSPIFLLVFEKGVLISLTMIVELLISPLILCLFYSYIFGAHKFIVVTYLLGKLTFSSS